MAGTLYGVLEDTLAAVGAMRASAELDAEIDGKLASFEETIRHVIASSPDRSTVARADEYVALNALCDLHVAIQSRPESLRSRLRPIVDEWISYAAATGLTPQELTRAAQQEPGRDAGGWLRAAK